MTQALALIADDKLAAMLAEDPKLKSAETRRGYRRDITRFDAWRQGAPVSKLTLERWAAEMQRAGRSPNSINRGLAALRWYARRVADYALESGRADARDLAEQALRAAEVADVSGERGLKGREVHAGELAALMRACQADETPAGVRDAALIALAAAGGLRVSEAAGLTLGSVNWLDEHECELTLKRTKGDKPRKLWLDNGAASALRDWLEVRGPGRPGEPLFVAVSKSGRVMTAPALRGRKSQAEAVLVAPGLRAPALQLILGKRAAEAGIDEPLSWHDFRRTFAGNLLDAGADLVTVQKLMGHSSPTTTSNYDRRGDETKRKALKALHVPYKSRRAK